MATFVAAQASGGLSQGNQSFQLDAGNGSNRAAVIHVAAYDAGQNVTFAVSAGGVAAGAPVVTQGNTSADGLLSTYVITGIPTGTITIQVNPSQTCDELFVMASTWSNVPQDTPVTDSESASGTGTSATIPAMTVGEGEVGIGALYYYVDGNSTAVPSDTGMGTFPGTSAVSGASHQYGDGTLSWTGLSSASAIWEVNGIVLGHDEDEPGDEAPEITAVDGDNTISSDQTGVAITGANFDNATVEIRQGAVAIEQTVTSQSSTSISIDVVFEIEGQPSLRFGTAELAVINTDGQEDTIEITIVPPSGELYVDVVSPVQDPDQALTADPPAATGDQVHVFGSGGGAAPAGLSINPDLTFEFAPESEPEAFAFRFWDVSDATWGDWATRSVGEELDETLIAGAAEASGRSLTLSLGASLTLQTGEVAAAGRALALSAGLSVAMERGSAAAQGREISVQTGASADVSLQRGVAESAGRATAVSAGLAVTLGRGAAQAAGREIVPEAGGEVSVLLQRGSALAGGRQLEPQHGHSLELARGSSRAVGRQLTVIVGDAAEVTLERGSADAEGRTLAVAAAAGPRLARGNASAVGRSLVPLHGRAITLARGRATARGRVLSVFTGIALQTPVLRPRSRSMTAGRSSVSKTPRYSSRKV